MVDFFLKSAFGRYIGVLKAPRPLYTILTPTFKYSETVCNIEER